MALDLEKIKRRLAALQGKTESSFVKLEEGKECVLRIVEIDGDAFKDYTQHYGVGKARGFLCPKRNFGEDCPVCEFAHNLYVTGKENQNKEDMEAAKKLFAKQRFYSPVVVRGEEDKGILWWSYSKTVYERLINIMTNPEYGDITDVKVGTDLVVKMTKVGGKLFPETTVEPKRRTTPLASSDEEINKLLTNIPDIGSTMVRKTTKEVQQILNEYMFAGETSSEEGFQEVEKYSEEKTAKKSGKTQIDEAFDELLGEQQ